MADTTDLICVEDLTVSYPKGVESIRAVRQASFRMRAGEVVGILGESGSGKTTLGLSMAGMLPPGARYDSGTVKFRGANLLGMTEKQLTAIRGAQIAVIWQDPALALNPVMRVGKQIAEVLRAHGCGERQERSRRVEDWLREVGFESPSEIAGAYPHQLSGGQRQRVAIAQALCCRPALLIADEPTSKLDAPLQVDILRLLAELRERHNMACLIISHDPTVFAGWVDRILVMYAGEIVEEGPAEQVLQGALHPYSQALAQLARPSASQWRQRLKAIEGEPPGPRQQACGCAFHPRCPERLPVCSVSHPARSMPEPDRQVSCFKYE